MRNARSSVPVSFGAAADRAGVRARFLRAFCPRFPARLFFAIRICSGIQNSVSNNETTEQWFTPKPPWSLASHAHKAAGCAHFRSCSNEETFWRLFTRSGRAVLLDGIDVARVPRAAHRPGPWAISHWSLRKVGG